MEWIDPLYGSQDISEPVLLALMDTRALQRLGGVLQHGITALLGITQLTSRPRAFGRCNAPGAPDGGRFG